MGPSNHESRAVEPGARRNASRWLTAYGLKAGESNVRSGVHMDMGHGSLRNWQYQRNYISSFGGLKAGNKTVKGGRQRQRQPLKYANVDCLHLFLLLLHIGATSTGQGREDGSSTDKRRENNRYPGQVGPRCLSLAFDASSCTSFAALICRPLIYLAKLYIHTPIYIYVL